MVMYYRTVQLSSWPEVCCIFASNSLYLWLLKRGMTFACAQRELEVPGVCSGWLLANVAQERCKAESGSTWEIYEGSAPFLHRRGALERSLVRSSCSLLPEQGLCWYGLLGWLSSACPASPTPLLAFPGSTSFIDHLQMNPCRWVYFREPQSEKVTLKNTAIKFLHCHNGFFRPLLC